MNVEVRIPRMLSETVKTDAIHTVTGASVAEALRGLFSDVPGLRQHIVNESGAIRPHVSVFVDGVQADLDTALEHNSKIRILHAVSGG